MIIGSRFPVVAAHPLAARMTPETASHRWCLLLGEGRHVPPRAGQRGGSRFPRCATELRARDVLPIAGFLLLRGRCRGLGWRTLTGTWPGRSLAARSGPALSCRPVRCRVAACWSRRLWWCLPHISCVTPDGFWWPGLPLPVGVALLTFGLVGLMEGRWVAYGAGGLLRAGAWLAGVAVAYPAAAASRAVDACSRQKVSHDRLSQPPVDPHLPRV